MIKINITFGNATHTLSCFREYNENHLLFKPVAWCGKQWENWSKPSGEDVGKIFGTLKKIAIFVPLILATIGASFIGIFGFLGPSTTKVIHNGFNNSPQVIIGSGKLVKKKIELSMDQFETLYLRCGNVTVKQGANNSLVLLADDNLINLLSQKVDKNKLILGVRPNTSFQTSNPIQYELTVASPLKSLIVSGSGDITTHSGVDADNLTCQINGSGDISVLTGQEVTSQTIIISGSGDYLAPNLKAMNSHITISGSGNATVQGVDKLFVKILGSGDCLYSETPEISKKIHGSGEIRQI